MPLPLLSLLLYFKIRKGIAGRAFLARIHVALHAFRRPGPPSLPPPTFPPPSPSTMLAGGFFRAAKPPTHCLLDCSFLMTTDF